MSANERLQQLQAALIEQGIVDFKFYIRRKEDTTDESVTEDIVHLLGSFERGEMIDHDPIGDDAARVRAL